MTFYEIRFYVVLGRLLGLRYVPKLLLFRL
jgi:hypothetical protein